MKGFGRPKELSAKEEDVRQWSKKTEAFFADVIDEMMLEWSAEYVTDITQELIGWSGILANCDGLGARGATHGSHEL